MRAHVNSFDVTREEEIIGALTSYLGADKILEAKVPRERRIFVTIARADVKAALGFLAKEWGFGHLSTITGVDLKDRMEVLYHLNDGNVTLSVRVAIRREDPPLPTVVDILPGAVLYEREVHEMFGIVFEGHPNLAPLLLPDDWPEGLYPLRKHLSPELIRGVLADARATIQTRR
jgi:NADH:ubiquinone oxidoreductase subunit C